jgi:IS30 family transposase
MYLGLSIEERPKSINKHSEYRHWEIDTVFLT